MIVTFTSDRNVISSGSGNIIRIPNLSEPSGRLSSMIVILKQISVSTEGSVRTVGISVKSDPAEKEKKCERSQHSSK